MVMKGAGHDATLLFNVGPMPSGEIQQEHGARLAEMGDWLKENGASIYATRGGPYPPSDWGVSTHKGDTVYLHVLDWPEEGLELPSHGRKIKRAAILGGRLVSIEEKDGNWRFDVLESRRDEIDTIIRLWLEPAK